MPGKHDLTAVQPIEPWKPGDPVIELPMGDWTPDKVKSSGYYLVARVRRLRDPYNAVIEVWPDKDHTRALFFMATI